MNQEVNEQQKGRNDFWQNIKTQLKTEIEDVKKHPYKNLWEILKNAIITFIIVFLLLYATTRLYTCQADDTTYYPEAFNELTQKQYAPNEEQPEITCQITYKTLFIKKGITTTR